MELHHLIPGLVDDIVGEIFHQFIAVDWEGPFLLMLVSKGWRELVLSRPSFWIWIKIDDLQTDWREKMLIGQTLSRDLPLQLVVRMPFGHFEELSDLLPRFHSVFIDTSTHECGPLLRPTLVNQDMYLRNPPYYWEIHDEVNHLIAYLLYFLQGSVPYNQLTPLIL